MPLGGPRPNPSPSRINPADETDDFCIHPHVATLHYVYQSVLYYALCSQPLTRLRRTRMKDTNDIKNDSWARALIAKNRELHKRKE